MAKAYDSAPSFAKMLYHVISIFTIFNQLAPEAQSLHCHTPSQPLSFTSTNRISALCHVTNRQRQHTEGPTILVRYKFCNDSFLAVIHCTCTYILPSLTMVQLSRETFSVPKFLPFQNSWPYSKIGEYIGSADN